eukprot:CFRG6388T1
MRCMSSRCVDYPNANNTGMFHRIKSISHRKYRVSLCRLNVTKGSPYSLSPEPELDVVTELTDNLHIEVNERKTVRFLDTVRVLEYNRTLPTFTCSHSCHGDESCDTGSDNRDSGRNEGYASKEDSSGDEVTFSGAISAYDNGIGLGHQGYNPSRYDHHSNFTEDDLSTALIKKSTLKSDDVHHTMTSTAMLRQDRRNQNVVVRFHSLPKEVFSPSSESSDSESGNASLRVQEIIENNSDHEYLIFESGSNRSTLDDKAMGTGNLYNHSATPKRVQLMHSRYAHNRRAVVVNARINNHDGLLDSKRCGRVIVRYSSDNWNSFADTEPGEVIIPNPLYTSYKIMIPVDADKTEPGTCIKFAVCLQANEYQTFWDNNDDSNYEVTIPDTQS